MAFDKILKQFSSSPKRLFLIDGIGALLSAFLLGFVLVQFERIFGIPRSTLYFLAFIPCLFAVYDFYCYRIIKRNIGFYLRVIAFLNLLYCAVSIGFMIYHFQTITVFGWAYIILEILIVISLVMLELKTAESLDDVI